MKKDYQRPAIHEVKIQPHHHILSYSVKEYDNGGEETIKDDSDW